MPMTLMVPHNSGIELTSILILRSLSPVTRVAPKTSLINQPISHPHANDKNGDRTIKAKATKIMIINSIYIYIISPLL